MPMCFRFRICSVSGELARIGRGICLFWLWTVAASLRDNYTDSIAPTPQLTRNSLEGCTDATPETCFTVWDKLTCDRRFSLISKLARADGVGADVVFGDPERSITFFAVIDVFAKNTTVLPGLQGLSRLDAPLKQSSLLSMTYLEDLSPERLLLQRDLVSALQVMNGSVGPSSTEVVGMDSDGKMYIDAKGQRVDLPEVIVACNGYIYPVDRYWFKFADEYTMKQLERPINENPAIKYQNRCNSTDDDFREAFSMKWDSTKFSDMFEDLLLDELTGNDVSFTLFIPVNVSHLETIADAEFGWSYLLSHIIPGANCPWGLLDMGHAETVLGMATAASSFLYFYETDENSLRVTREEADRSQSAEVVSYFTTCRGVVYLLESALPAPNLTPLTSGNASLLDEQHAVHSLSTLTQPYDGVPWSCPSFVLDVMELEHDPEHGVALQLVSDPVYFEVLPEDEARYEDLKIKMEQLHIAYRNNNSDEYVASNSTGSMPLEDTEATSSDDSSRGYVIPVAAAVSATVLGIAFGFLLFKRVHRRQLRAGRIIPQLDPHARSGSGFSSVGKVDALLRDNSMLEMLKVDGTAGDKGADTPKAGIESGGSQELRAVLEKLEHSANWIIEHEEVTYGKIIGQGSFGEVYLATWKGVPVAVKKLPTVPKELAAEHEQFVEGLKALQKEVSIVAGLRHPNIVMFLGVGLDPPCLVQEYCHQGSLYHVLRRARTLGSAAAQLDWKKRLMMAFDAAVGMAFLHCHNPPILHCDLKSPNLLVDKTWHVKVADFGLSRIVDPNKSRTSLITVNPRWVAPEVIQSSKPSAAADVFSYGIILWELLTFQEPYSEASPLQIMFAVVNSAERPDVPDLDSVPGGTFPGIVEYIALMQRCWAQDPEDRPKFGEICDKLRELRRNLRVLHPTGASNSSASPPSASHRAPSLSPALQSFTRLATHTITTCGTAPPVTSPFAAIQGPLAASSVVPDSSMEGDGEGGSQDPGWAFSSEQDESSRRPITELTRQSSDSHQETMSRSSGPVASGDLVERVVLEVESDTS